MREILRIVGVSAVLIMLSTYAGGAEYDLVILNGRVIDPETESDAVRNVGIRDGQIAAVTEADIAGVRTLDATGLVVAPGFIDLHVHAIDLPLIQKLLLRDGVTTQLELEGGAYPVDHFYAYMKGRAQAHYGATIATASIREKVFPPEFESATGLIGTDLDRGNCCTDGQWLSKTPNDEELARLYSLTEEGLREGALGVSVGIGYLTKSAPPRETLGWQQLAGKYGRATYVHARFSSQKPPTTGILAIQEWLASAYAYGGGVVLHHFHQQALALVGEAIELIDAARAKGLSVLGEVYPYNFGYTIVAADYLRPANYELNMGRTYEDIIELTTMEPLTKERYEYLVENDPYARMLFNGASEEDLLKALAHPGIAVGADAVSYRDKDTGKRVGAWDTPYENLVGHPRSAGTHAKVLRLSREQKLMPLMTAIKKMTYLQARFLENNGVAQMKKKGKIVEGADADITIFDPISVKDNSTIQKPGLPSTGIPYVIVGGTIVVSNSKVVKDTFPGQPVRTPIARKRMSGTVLEDHLGFTHDYVPDMVPQIPTPRAEELNVIREHVNPRGVLRPR